MKLGATSRKPTSFEGAYFSPRTTPFWLYYGTCPSAVTRLLVMTRGSGRRSGIPECGLRSPVRFSTSVRDNTATPKRGESQISCVTASIHGHWLHRQCCKLILTSDANFRPVTLSSAQVDNALYCWAHERTSNPGAAAAFLI